MTRPYRSALYIPGSRPRALDKARGLAVDVILFDLEDAVTPDEKGTAGASNGPYPSIKESPVGSKNGGPQKSRNACRHKKTYTNSKE